MKNNSRYFFSTYEEAEAFILSAQNYAGKSVKLSDKQALALLKTCIVLSRHIAPYLDAVLAKIAYSTDKARDREILFRSTAAPLIKLIKWLDRTFETIWPNKENTLSSDFNFIARYALYNSVSFKESYEINYLDLYEIQENYREPEFDFESDYREDKAKKALYISKIFSEMIRYSIETVNPTITFPLFSQSDLEAYGDVRVVTNGKRNDDKTIAYLDRLSSAEKHAIGVNNLDELQYARTFCHPTKKDTLIYRIGESIAKDPILRKVFTSNNITTEEAIKILIDYEDSTTRRYRNNITIAKESRVAEIISKNRTAGQ